MPSAAPAAESMPTAARPIMVMLVDDQAFVAETVHRQLLEAPDINLHYCADPDQAIATAERIGPAVILLDLIMPDIDGLTLCRFFRSHPATRDIPVIMLSSTEDAAAKAEAFAAGANDYLVKLPDQIEMVARLRYHSRAYIHMLQRDDAYRALRASQMKLEELNLGLLKLANQDGLTGLANRRYFDERFAVEWARASRGKKPISLIMVDADHFKRFNDRFGHLEGDDCLKRIAAAVQRSAGRPGDLVARYGGEEFIALLPETGSAGAEVVAERMREAVQDQCGPHSDGGERMTISLGVASTIPAPGTDSGMLVRLADSCLYEAKKQGRNCVRSAVLSLDDSGQALAS